VDIVTDGEQRRDNFYSFVAEKLAGVQLMTLLEMLDIVEDKAGFERILQTLDVPAYSMRNPTCVGRLERRQPLAVDELRFLKRHTDKPIKIPLPGPYILTRAMFVQEVTRQVYPTKEDLAEDVVHILGDEVAELVAEGVDFIQLDEPVLTELVFTQGQTRTFMCAALATRSDPSEELEFAVALINRVLEWAGGVRTGLHICRGNWSQNEATLLRAVTIHWRPTSIASTCTSSCWNTPRNALALSYPLPERNSDWAWSTRAQRPLNLWIRSEPPLRKPCNSIRRSGCFSIQIVALARSRTVP
jgi:5-methyltetrahydropteroyltriglutamate--homocysteine methyltransferase